MPIWILCRLFHRRKHKSMGQEHYSRIIKVPENQNMWVTPNTLPALPLNINGSLPEESEPARHDALLILGNTPVLNSSWAAPGPAWTGLNQNTDQTAAIHPMAAPHPSTHRANLSTFSRSQAERQTCSWRECQSTCCKIKEEGFDLSSFRCSMLNCIRLCSLSSAHFKCIFCFLQGVLHSSYYSCSIFSYWLL